MSASQSVIMFFASLFIIALIVAIGATISIKIVNMIDGVGGQSGFVPPAIRNLWSNILPLIAIIFIVLVAGVFIKLFTTIFRTEG